MTATIIITFCLLLLIAYLFDITSPKTKIPSVILLLALGWLLKEAVALFKIPMPDIEFALPLLGTAGLILIVLDGALDLELDESKFWPISNNSFCQFLFKNPRSSQCHNYLVAIMKMAGGLL